MTLSPDQIRLARSIAMPGRDIVAAIVAELARTTETPEAEIRTPRSRASARLRQMAMCLARQAGLSQPVIAACFGVDCSTVHHAEKAFNTTLARPVFRSVRAARDASDVRRI